MNELNQSGKTTSSAGITTTFNYEKQRVIKNMGKSKVQELPTFKTMPIVSAFEEIKDTINNQKNIFGDLLTEGDLTILFGRSNVGKSFLSYQIGEAVATGKNVLNVMDIIELKNYGETQYYNLNNETQAQKVLYVDFEATVEKDYIRYSTKDQKVSGEKPYQFSTNFITAFPDRLSVADNLMFIDAIELDVIKTGARVLIIDNMSAISTDNEKSGNAAKLMNKVKDLQRRNKLTVLLMAHTPKIVQGEAIIANNLAGSSNLYNLADSVMAINMTTMSDNIRYIKQLKSRYNEIRFDKDNVIAITFDIRTDGLKGFSFQNYETEDELIKPIDKSTKADEDREIIDLIKHFGSTIAQIAEELHQRYAPDAVLSTYKERIKKRVQRLRAKGLIEEASESTPIVTPMQTVEKPSPYVATSPNVVEIASPYVEIPPIALKNTSPRLEIPTKVLQVPEKTASSVSTPKSPIIDLLTYDGDDEDLKALKADLLVIQANPVNITDNYDDIFPY
jgi:archaellum biogenesis ATPase FlaH